MSRILVVEDEAVIRGEVRRMLTRHGHEVVEAESVDQALALRPHTFDLVISDLRLPGAPGTEIIPGLAGRVPVLIMTAFATVRSAVDAMKVGAADYISKPFDAEELLPLVDRLIRGRSEAPPGPEPSAEAAEGPGGALVCGGILAGCAAMRDVLERVHRVAPTAATVLVLGESGTGKELVARALHAHSPRSEGAFVAVNCASIPEGLVESELFGHEKGAFTGAEEKRDGLVTAAHGGTLFLDEVGELPLPAQARLLRLLQESEVRPVGASQVRKVDVRIIAATHRDLPSLVRERSFREDLYFRLRVVDIALPPLRERGEDVVALARHLLARAAARVGRETPRLSPEAVGAIRAHPWPGNVRELENAVERAVILADGDRIDEAALGLVLEASPGSATAASGSAEEVPEDSLTEYFVRFVETHQGQLSETEIARRLGISRKALWERRRRLGIPRPKSSVRVD